MSNSIRKLNKNVQNVNTVPSGASPLILNVNNAAAQVEEVYKLRKKIYNLRKVIGDNVKRVLPCGRFPTAKNGVIPAVKGSSGKLFYSALQTCKSVWACPVCSLKINQQRQHEVREYLTEKHSEGCKSSFLTLTIPHYSEDQLGKLRDTVKEVFRLITAHRRYKNLKKKYGVIGYIRALEVTKGVNGWHPHLHVCFIFKPLHTVTPVDQKNERHTQILEFGDEYFSIWQDVVFDVLGRMPSVEAFQNKLVYDQEGISDYITKWDLSKELTEGHSKKEGRGGRTPFQLVNDYIENDDQAALSYFIHFTESFHGVRQLTTSRDIKLSEMSEEEIVKDEDITEILFTLKYDLFKLLHKKSDQVEVLKAYEENKLQGVFDYLSQQYEIIITETEGGHIQIEI